jgi:hypothetical protein
MELAKQTCQFLWLTRKKSTLQEVNAGVDAAESQCYKKSIYTKSFDSVSFNCFFCSETILI